MSAAILVTVVTFFVVITLGFIIILVEMGNSDPRVFCGNCLEELETEVVYDSCPYCRNNPDLGWMPYEEEQENEEEMPQNIPRPDPHPFPPIIFETEEDEDPNEKGGGKDPIVIGEFWYDEQDCLDDRTLPKFDYDNDSHGEIFCYVTIGDILTVHAGEGINHGYNLLNFDNTSLQGMSPVDLFRQYENICNEFQCNTWKDSNMNLIAEEHELTPYNFEIEWVKEYDEPIKHRYLDWTPRYINCEGMTTQGDKFYCIDPTYSMRSN